MIWGGDGEQEGLQTGGRGREGALRSMTAPAGVCTVRTIWRRASEGPFLRAKFARFPSSRPLLSPGKVSSLHAGARPGAKRGCPPLLPHHLPCSLPPPRYISPAWGLPQVLLPGLLSPWGFWQMLTPKKQASRRQGKGGTNVTH